MKRFFEKCLRICQLEGFPDMLIEMSKAGNMAWIKGPKCEFNKIELQAGIVGNEAFAMFLHELAHHIYAKECAKKKEELAGLGLTIPNGKGHDGRFADIFTHLVGKYMVRRPFEE